MGITEQEAEEKLRETLGDERIPFASYYEDLGLDPKNTKILWVLGGITVGELQQRIAENEPMLSGLNSTWGDCLARMRISPEELRIVEYQSAEGEFAKFDGSGGDYLAAGQAEKIPTHPVSVVYIQRPVIELEAV